MLLLSGAAASQSARPLWRPSRPPGHSFGRRPVPSLFFFWSGVVKASPPSSPVAVQQVPEAGTCTATSPATGRRRRAAWIWSIYRVGGSPRRPVRLIDPAMLGSREKSSSFQLEPPRFALDEIPAPFRSLRYEA